MKTWDEVSQSPEFIALPAKEKEIAREQYFNEVVAPRVPTTERSLAKAEFDKDTRSSVGRYYAESAGKGLLDLPWMALSSMFDSPSIKLTAKLFKDLGLTGGRDMHSDMKAALPEVRRQVERDVGIQDVAPPSAAHEYGGNTLRFLSGGLPISAPAMVAAKAGQRGAVALTELASGVGGGFGMTVGRQGGEALDKKLDTGNVLETVGEIGGGLFGGGLGAVAVPQVLYRGGKAAAQTLKERKVHESVGEEAGKIIEAKTTSALRESLQSDPRIPQNMQEAAEAAKLIPDFHPDLAMASGAPAVSRLKVEIESSKPELARRGIEETDKVNRALDNFLNARFEKAEKDVQTMSAAELRKYNDLLDQEMASVRDERERLLAQAREGHFSADMGEKAVELYHRAKRTASEASARNYEGVYRLGELEGFTGNLDDIVGYLRTKPREPGEAFTHMPRAFRFIEDRAKRLAAETQARMVQRAFPEAPDDLLAVAESRMPDSIVAAVAKYGGLSKKNLGMGELPDVGRTPGWAKRGKEYSFHVVHDGKNAKNMDEMREYLQQRGYLDEADSIQDMVNKIRDELDNGAPLHFSMNDINRAAEILNAQHMMKGAVSGEAPAPVAAQEFPVDVRAMHSLLKDVRAELRKASPNEARLLKPIEEMVDAKLQQYPEMLDALKQADDFHAQYVGTFREGVGGAVPDMRPEVVMRKFLMNGETGAAQFKQIYGTGHDAMQFAKNGVLDALAETVGRNKEITPQAVDRFMVANRKFLSAFPDIMKDLRDAERTAQQILKREGEIGAQQKELAADVVSNIAGLTGDPKAFFTNIAANDVRMRQLLEVAKRNPDFAKGVVRHYAEIVRDVADPQAFLVQNEARLKPIFDLMGKDHWDNVKTLALGVRVARRGAPEAVYKQNQELDPVKKATGTGVSTLFSLGRGALFNKVSPGWILIDVGGRMKFKLRQEEANALMERAMYDPDVAKKIRDMQHEINLPNPNYSKIIDFFKSLRPFLGRHALRVGIGAYDDEDEAAVAQ